MSHTTPKPAKQQPKRLRKNQLNEEQQARFYAALVREGFLMEPPYWTTQPLRV
jgi:hypothetical protein